jgi:uncharacterized membrane protein
LVFAGRHSLAVYLLHQPLLIGCVWLFSQVFPADMAMREAHSCEVLCQQNRDTAFCVGYCGCMLTTIERDGKLDALIASDPSEAFAAYLGATAGTCTMLTEDSMPEGDRP